MSSSRNRPTFADGSYLEVDGNGNLSMFNKSGVIVFTFNSAGLPVMSGGVALLGAGFSSVVGSTFEKAETGADANILTYVPGAADESVLVSMTVDVSAEVPGAGALTISATYKDSNGTAVSKNIAWDALASNVRLQSIVGTGNYYANLASVLQTGTNLVIASAFTGTSVAFVITVKVLKR